MGTIQKLLKRGPRDLIMNSFENYSLPVKSGFLVVAGVPVLMVLSGVLHLILKIKSVKARQQLAFLLA